MSLRIIIHPDRIHDWITQRHGTPAHQRGTDSAPRILFGPGHDEYDKLTVDELIEAMKFHHLVLLVDEAPGQTFHKFVERG